MLGQLRHRLTYANVMSTLSVFIALGGTTYAAAKINGRDITNRSIAASKVKLNALGSNEIRESGLRRVPHAEYANRAGTIGGRTAESLLVRCPIDTFYAANVCIEKTPRAPAPYGSAVLACEGPGFEVSRRLPTHGELQIAVGSGRAGLADGGELTSTVVPSSSFPGEVDVIYLTSGTGTIGVAPDRPEGSKAFRCVTSPFN